MALRRALSKRLFNSTTRDSQSPITTLVQSPPPPPPMVAPPNASDSAAAGLFRRFLQWRAINHHSSPDAYPSFLSLPVGEKLRERLKSMNVAGDQRFRLDGLSPPLAAAPAEEEGLRVAAADVKRMMRFVQLEKVRERLRNIPASTIPYGEFVRVCGDVSGDGEMGLEYAKASIWKRHRFGWRCFPPPRSGGKINGETNFSNNSYAKRPKKRRIGQS